MSADGVRVFAIGVTDGHEPSRLAVDSLGADATGLHFCTKVRALKVTKWLLGLLGSDVDAAVVVLDPRIRHKNHKSAGPWVAGRPVPAVGSGLQGGRVDLSRLSDEVEAVSVSYASALGIERDATWFLLKLQEEIGELTQAFLMRTGQARTKGNSPQQLDDKFREEMADVLSHVLLMARHHGVDLQREVERKWLTWRPGS